MSEWRVRRSRPNLGLDMDVVRGRLGAAGAIAACAVSLWFAATAGAQAGAATCASPVGVPRAERLGGLSLDKAQYRITVLDSARTNCTETSAQLRRFVN